MHRLLLTVLVPVLALVGLAALVRWAGAATATVVVAGVLVAVAYVAGRRARSALRSTGLVVLALVILAVAAAPPALAADAAAASPPWWVGIAIDVFIGVLAAPLASLLVFALYRFSRLVGIQVEDAARERFEVIVANGLAEAARRAGVRLGVDLRDLPSIQRDVVVGEAVDYVTRHGAGTLKRLGVKPKARAAIEEAVSARLGRLAA